MRYSTVLAMAVLTAPATAQLNNVLPTSAIGIAGNSSNAFPWGTAATAWPGLRILCIYDSTHFTNAPSPITSPILITNVRWRANDSTSTWSGGTFNQATLGLGTAPIDHTAASATWATNIGPDYTTVYSGPVTVTPGTGGGVGVPGPWVVDIQLSTPFTYDPNLGDLVVDTNWVTGAWGGGTQATMDVHSTNLLARRVYSSSMYPVANGVDSSVPVIEVGYIPAGPGTVALNTTLGAGCINVPEVSSYELFATAGAFDLANTVISMIHTGSGYLAIPGATAYIPPTPAAQVLALTDNSELAVTLSQPMPVGNSGTTTTLTVCSNGFISSGTGNGVGTSPVVNTFLNSTRAWWSLGWHNFNPAIVGGGSVKFEQLGNLAIVTWDGVWDAAGTSAANASTMQAQFDVTSGTVHYVYGAMSTIGTTGFLVGFSSAGASSNPGSMDISAALPTTYFAATFPVLPLTLAGVTRPIIGTNWSLNVTNVPAGGTIGVDVFGLTDPGIPDLGFLGMPTCGLRASLDLLQPWLVAGTAHAHAFAVPNDPALINLHVFTTSAVFQPGANPFGAITSNGIDGRIGDI